LKIGIDIVEIERIAELSQKQHFLDRIYTEKELAFITEAPKKRAKEFLAGRFAVKEAVAKALGTGIAKGVSFQHIETLQGELGEPILRLSGKALEIAEGYGWRQFHVSISHTNEVAVAYVLLE
jgi:holo-[acyl-carrier protein] synthase